MHLVSEFSFNTVLKLVLQTQTTSLLHAKDLLFIFVKVKTEIMH